MDTGDALRGGGPRRGEREGGLEAVEHWRAGRVERGEGQLDVDADAHRCGWVYGGAGGVDEAVDVDGERLHAVGPEREAGKRIEGEVRERQGEGGEGRAGSFVEYER